MSATGTVPIPPERREKGHWIIEGMATQGRVIGALVMREMQTRFGRHNLGFLWLFFEPLFLGSMVGVMHLAHGQRLPGGADPFIFSIVGYVPFFMFRSIVNRAGSAIHANLTLLFHRQVTPADVMIARNLLEAVAVVGVIAIILTVAAWFAEILPANPGLIAGTLALLFLLCHGASLLVAAASSRWDSAERLIHPITYLMMPLSGAFFALHWMSPGIRELLLWNPLVSIHEAIRHGIFGDAFPSYYDLFYVGQWILVVNLLGMLALRTARRKLEIF
ncbi:ABC transporter permease [Muricoccus pecuniae]|uniref:Capsular polysaccharide transport system permease protein n=1 Tax=Muricoccus pecuniae TaxID=693023 RepID=A0A840XY54_9PROT|nr:ABC transporter permease [Roseomonas pecuniae]MBB5692170.1 capsular polysaccharide transport system permease protein [Roseomonas pecuniae]